MTRFNFESVTTQDFFALKMAQIPKIDSKGKPLPGEFRDTAIFMFAKLAYQRSDEAMDCDRFGRVRKLFNVSGPAKWTPDLLTALKVDSLKKPSYFYLS